MLGGGRVGRGFVVLGARSVGSFAAAVGIGIASPSLASASASASASGLAFVVPWRRSRSSHCGGGSRLIPSSAAAPEGYHRSIDDCCPPPRIGKSVAAMSSDASPPNPPPPAAAASDPSSEEEVAQLRARKRELRKSVRSKLKAMSQEDIESESEKVWENLFETTEYREAKSVALFLSMPRGEIVTDTALAKVLDDGKDLYVPRVGLDFEKCDMEMIKVVDVKPASDEAGVLARSHARARKLFYHDWPRNKWGIPEPPPEIDHEVAAPGDIDLIVVPGLAFDGCGGRLGQGKGYYDRFIARMRGGPPAQQGGSSPGTEDGGDGGGDGGARKKRKKIPVLVAVGLGASHVEGDGPQVPMSPHDYPMDVLVLPSGSMSIVS